MKKILLCTTVLAGIASSAFAADMTGQNEAMTVSVAGSSKFEGGYIKRDRAHKDRFTFSPNQSSTAFLTSNKVAVKAQGTSDDVTYGAVVRLQTVANASNGMTDSGMDRSMLFVNTNAGAVQLGTNFSASKLLAVDAGTIAAATGGVAGGDAWAFIDNSDRTVTGSLIVDNTDLLANRIDSEGESYRKITYLSPEVSGVQLGLSFAPDAENNGAQNFTTENSARYLGAPVAVKNIWSGALKFKHSMDDVNMQLSLTGDMGKASKRPFQAANGETVAINGEEKTISYPIYASNNSNRHDLRSYALGGVVDYQGFSVALSYSNDGKSMSPKNVSKFRASWWTAGLGYKNGPMNTSLTFLSGKKGSKSENPDLASNGNLTETTTKAVSLGADYAVVPGMTPFGEVTMVQVKPKYIIDGHTKEKATVFILGARAKF